MDSVNRDGSPHCLCQHSPIMLQFIFILYFYTKTLPKRILNLYDFISLNANLSKLRIGNPIAFGSVHWMCYTDSDLILQMNLEIVFNFCYLDM